MIRRIPSEAERKSSIARKLFSRPRHRDRYKRLTPAEINYILKHVRLTGKEIEVFRLRCRGLNFEEISWYAFCHISSAKKTSAKVEAKIKDLTGYDD